MVDPGDEDKDKKKKKKAYVLAEHKPKEGGGRDESFITEAKNLETFYRKNDSNTDVVILPFYGEEEFNSIKDKIQDISDNDEVFIFGHSGSKIGGIDNETIASTLKDKGIKNCSLGSCNFENYVDPYKDIQNVTYRGKDQWLGVNPNAKDLTSAMYSRANDYDKGEVSIVKPEEGVQYNRIFNRPIIEAINSVSNRPPIDNVFKNRRSVASFLP